MKAVSLSSIDTLVAFLAVLAIRSELHYNVKLNSAERREGV